MANNSQPPGGQPIWPPSSGTLSSPNFAPQMNMQYRSMVPGQQGQQYFSTASQQFRPVGQVMPSGGPDLRPQYSHSVQQLPQRAGQPLHTHPMHYVQANMPLPSGSPQPQQGAAGVNVVSSYRPQTSANAPSEVPPMPHMHAPVGQPWSTTGGLGASAAVAAQQTAQQPVTTSSADGSASDWQEHEAANGRRYYYNKKTKQSSWDKPSELMTPIERADASTVWKEFTTADGRKYYNHKVTKQSVWTMPEEMKLARERALREAAGLDGSGSVSQGPSVPETVETSAPTSTFPGMASSPLPVTLAAPVPNATTGTLPGSTPVASSVGTPNRVADQNLLPPKPTTPFSPASVNANSTPRNDNVPTQDIASSGDGPSFQRNEEARNGTATAGKVIVTSKEEKPQEDEPFLYSSKQEAKNAFKALLESVNVQSDWSWEQAMREIVNDRRYGALKTLGERKQAFNEYLGQRKKLEAEERRIRQKKAREEFTKMLEESKELTSSVKWSKAISMFENDERFKAVERNRDREDLYESYIVDLARKEREKAAEEHRHNIMEYKEYLQSCDFIKVSSQWRKILDRLEDDDRCSRLEKIDRLLVFQDYIRDLEVEEEEEKKKQKDQIRRSERKNRDEFRKLMDSHVAEGILTAKTYWRDYCLKVRDAPEYEAVVSNTSGSTPRDLFEDVLEDLENQYHEDKSRVKDVMKTGKISSVSTWAFEDFKAAIMEDIGEPGISDINMKLVFEELLERAKEKEEKEAKKRQRLADDFTSLLHDTKEITMSSNWDECKPLFEESQEFTSVGDESVAKEIFEEYIIYLQEKAKDKERKKEEEKARKEEKERRKEKERKERDKERERERGKEKSKKDESDSDTAEVNDTYKEDRKREKDKDRKHRKRHPTASDDVYSDKDEKDSKRSKRHSSDRKKSKKHAHSPESDSESRHKRHKRDRDGSRRNGDHEELEDGEVGEDGEIQ